MDVLSVILIAAGIVLMILSIYKPNQKFMREFAIFLTGFGLGILTLVIKNTYKISITTEENYYLKNLGVFMAVITAISATFISIWQGFENRQAHRKGVLPYLNINRDSFTYVSRPVISISNTGVGPARINDIYFYMGEEKFEGKDNNERFTAFFRQALAYGFKGELGTTLSYGTFIQVGQTFRVFEFDKEKIDPAQLKRCEEFYKSIRIEMSYADIYGTNFKGSANFN